MRIQPGQLVSLGYGKFVRSDEVVAVEPITGDRGPGRRSLVWVRGLPAAPVASRADASIVDDLVAPAEEAARMHQLRGALEHLVAALRSSPPLLRRMIVEEAGTDLSELLGEAERAAR